MKAQKGYSQDKIVTKQQMRNATSTQFIS